jgi:CMP-N,N'-diacetyllegionaminic acid synthase
MRTIAFIPARGGSKGLINKNLCLLNGIPLISHTIQAAMRCKVISKTVVSSDSTEILEFALRNHAKALRRPKEISQDNSPTDLSIEHGIKELKLKKGDRIALLQATSPLRTTKHLQEALMIFNERQPELVVSVRPQDNKFLKSYFIKGKHLSPIISKEMAYLPRQALPDIFMPNGAIYIFSVEAFQRELKIPRNNVVPYIMDEISSLDIDNADDLKKAENILTAQP